VCREAGGGLPGVRALGVPLTSRGLVQVTMNLVSYRRTPVARVMAAVEAEAARRGVEVLEWELVGCAPADAFAGVDRARVRLGPAQLLDPASSGSRRQRVRCLRRARSAPSGPGSAPRRAT